MNNYIRNHEAVSEYWKDSDGCWVILRDGYLIDGAQGFRADSVKKLQEAIKTQATKYQFFLLGSSQSRTNEEVAEDINNGYASLVKFESREGVEELVEDNDYGSWDELSWFRYEKIKSLIKN